MVSIDEALRLIHENVPAVGTEILSIEEALGRVAAQHLHAAFDMPRFDHSAMDGYAVTLADAGGTIEPQTTIFAGDESDVIVKKGAGVKIMTGAMMPKGADAVIPAEETETLKDGSVRLPGSIRQGANIRKQGEEVAKGERILTYGDEVGAYTVALLASQGISYLQVHRKPAVTVFATGHELKMHYEKAEAHQIYNSNAPMLLSRCRELGCRARFTGATADTMASIERHIVDALGSDLIVTSGGVSVGDADFTLDAFEKLGMEILFQKVNMKPGKPVTVGRIGSTWVLNLPGNPSAAALTFELFGRSIIHRLRGMNRPFLSFERARNKTFYKLKPGRQTAVLGRYDGTFFEALDKQGPGMVRPLSLANAMIVTEKEVDGLKEGQEVKVLPLDCDRGSETPTSLFTEKAE
ncbi:gephyrin-like molybdotransferase Glp [Hydrogenimonas sp. SS33]|uniref:molybdopterin molybdotransferase MoeA n=1 Tax=Hydrogenimonas leucolamina TaxID=2954236 RepID=UPI00336C2F31